MKRAVNPNRQSARQTDLVAAVVTAVILVITTAWLVILLF